jgi:hypothetical protein
MAQANTIPGARFAGKNLFRPTAMSLAMACAGIIPAPHIINERANMGLLRHKADTNNVRPSAIVGL